MIRLIKTLFIVISLLTIVLTSCDKNKNPNDSKNIVKQNNKLDLEDGIYLLKQVTNNKDSINVLPNEAIVAINKEFDHNKEGQRNYYLIQKEPFVPLIIKSKPQISANKTPRIAGDTIRLSLLTIALASEYSQLLEDFTSENIGENVTIIIGGKAVTRHKIREKVSGGRLQISRCTDEACSVLLTELEDNVE